MTKEAILNEVRRILEVRVTAGIAWLEKGDPAWASRINLDTLNLMDCTECVIGQLWGDYGEFVNMEDSPPSYSLGFSFSGSDALGDMPYVTPGSDSELKIREVVYAYGWDVLQDTWKDRITAIRSGN